MRTIKEIRLSTGLSQKKFGDLLNIPMRTLQDWELGARQCPEYVVELIDYRVKHDESIPKDRGRFSVLTKNKPYAMLKQGDAICQEKLVNNQKAVFIT